MTIVDGIRIFVRDNVAEWRAIRIADLQFWHRSESRLVILGLFALAVILLIARSAIRRSPGRHHLVVPALLPTVSTSYLSSVRYVPTFLFFLGLPFFALALADPFTSLVASQVSYPGRRISVLVDASASMRTPFKAASLNRRAEFDSTFFTAVAAAERFIRMRMTGKYRDLVALVEFGNEAYVITPFTSDYDNILLSTSLIGDPVEFSLFPDQGTVIAMAIDQSVSLFKAFNFLDASGNVMVLFSDGEDTRAMANGKSLDEIVQETVDAKIPVYMVRTNYERGKGKVIPDDLWIPAITKTGGRFYAADSESALLSAIKEIDGLAAGTIQTKQYSRQRPMFGIFALAAVCCWITAAAAKLTIPQFQKLP